MLPKQLPAPFMWWTRLLRLSIYMGMPTSHTKSSNPYVDANASWSDADGTGIIVTNGEVNGSNPGTYLLSYNFIDTAGNAAEEITREVEVVNLPPVDLFILDDRNLSIQEMSQMVRW